MEVFEVQPSAILADDNSRFGLIADNIKAFAEEIVNSGGVRVPLEVENLDELGPNGEVYKLVTGFRRHAAVTLNNKAGAAMFVPVTVVQPGSALKRITMQISENWAREAMTPMDTAVAMKRLFDNGASKLDVRTAFPRSQGEKLKMSPASNACVNMYMSFLKLPKKAQTLLHTGFIGVQGAYKLTKAKPEDIPGIIDALEADRLKEVENDKKAETKLLEAEAKLAETTVAVETAKVETVELEKSVADKATAITEAIEKAKEAHTAYLLAPGKDSDPAKKVLKEAMQATQQQLKDVQAAKEAEEKKLEKAQSAFTKKAEQSAALAAKLADKKKAAAEAKKTEKPKASTTAQIDAKVKNGKDAVKGLNRDQIIRAVSDLATLAGTPPKTMAVGRAILDHITGAQPDFGKMYTAIKKAIGEK